ncbi:MAG: hypothetical protein U9Q71_11190, partial [Pseudomonadota bacterium]|nr:hypothetical protein [Pseudomonadota bacterium]
WRIRLAAGAGLLALIGFGRWLWPRLARRRQARRAAYAASEDAAFRELRKACRSGAAAETYNALLKWLRRWQGLRSTAELVGCYPDPGLAAELGKLQRAVVDSQAEWSGRKLFATLKRARETASRKEPALARGNPLGPLNPSALPIA